MLVVFGAREAGCFRELGALNSGSPVHFHSVPMTAINAVLQLSAVFLLL